MVGWTLYNMETGKYYKSSSVGGCNLGVHPGGADGSSVVHVHPTKYHIAVRGNQT